jgi:uncharacterized repeat protein (TIGR03803 family)
MRLRPPLLATLAFAAALARGQTYVDLHDFGATSTDGQAPNLGVAFDSAGNMYGTTYGGGTNLYYGTVWEITKPGAYRTLHDFGTGTDGQHPSAGVTFDGAGNLYGTATYGGLNGAGVIWEITKAGVYVKLHDFGGSGDGYYPTAGVTVDAAGNMYGTTYEGGAYSTGSYSGGIVWEITSTGVYKHLHDFGDGTDGFLPDAGVTLDASGNIFGTTTEGGSYALPYVGGILWEITREGGYKAIHNFGSYPDGSGPGAVVFDRAGNLYGTAASGGMYGRPGYTGGTIWGITAAGVYKDVHDFGNGADGQAPYGVAADNSGNLYGTCALGGRVPGNYALGCGILWQLTKAGAYSDLHDFGSGSDGVEPHGILLDADGNFFGTAADGGLNQYGMVWRYSNSVSLLSASISPSSVTGGSSSTGKVTLNVAAPFGGATISLSSDSASAHAPSSVTVPAGNTSATFTVSTSPVSTEVQGTITATLGPTSKAATLTVYPPSVTQVSVSPTSVNGSTSSTGKVTIASAAPAGGVPVTFSSTSADATVPSSVTVPAGATSATFTIKTVPVVTNVTATISATDGQVTKTATLTVEVPVLSSVVLNPSTVIGGTSTNCTVTISGPAPTGGFTLDLSSGSPSAGVPNSITIPAGKTSATFPVTTQPVATNTAVAITIKAGSVSKTATLTIDAPVLTIFTLSPTSVKGGNSSTGTLTLNGPAPAAGVAVKISSSSKDATVPASVNVASGNTTATFTVKTAAVKSSTSATITAKSGAVTKTETLAISP